MLFIGICGASGSGKSTLAEELARMVNKSILIINQDAYYYDHPDMSFEERCKLNYDEPSIFDHDLLLEDVRALLSGQRVLRKRYDYTAHRRAPQAEEYLEPHDVIVVEGIHAFYDERLRDMMDLKLFVRVDSDICLLRRIQRDINERGRAIDNISTQYLTTVKPMFDQYIRNYEQYADVIVARGGKNAKITEILAGYVNNDLHLYRGQSRRRSSC
ncbi:MAG: uridine kinase [Clostridiales bacterium]|nr:uridine kinase [Clostridiales bacterium]MDY3762993.1 uridine kinase [Candidatus Ventricola sp.]MCI6587763.1 uridine kinase [Clostridiales bacterium]MCI7703905.1 uridine kinase [Clostridiales bacterium]MDY3832723.1 uridine kinase [Candidatus Ventricola sp.]